MNDSWWVRPNQLDDHQKAVIALSGDESHVVVGPPGSGKTNLLLLRAKFAVLKKKPHVVIVVFTRTLQEFIRSGAPNYGLTAGQVRTFTSWLRDFIKEYGETPDDGDTFAVLRNNLVKQAWRIVEARSLKGVFDLLLIDEAQDYTPEEVRLFKQLGNLVFAAADSEQQVYAKTGGLEELKKLVPSNKELRFHYRNGLNICRLADAVMKPMQHHVPLANRSNYNEKANRSHYVIVKSVSVSEAVESAVKQIRIQLEAYPDELIGIACPTLKILREVWTELEKTDLADACVYQDRDEGYHAITNETRICLSTIHSAKGLEFRALHVIGLNALARAGQSLTRNVTYTAITRAKTALSLYPCGKMPDFLTSALSSLEAPAPDPDLEDLFETS